VPDTGAETETMDFYTVWPYFIGCALMLALASTPLLRLADSPPTSVPARVQTLDGLRGFLALSVFFHHAAIYHHYIVTGEWLPPPERFYDNLGGTGVSLFFMITGYLFWTQMLKSKGRPNLSRLYIGRVFRIVPMYLSMAVFVLLWAGVHTGWRLEESPLALIKNVTKWLAGGVLVGGDINTTNTIVVGGVTWSLQYEWAFYASLFITSLFARQLVAGALLPVIGVLAVSSFLVWRPAHFSLACILMFFVGMAAASAKRVCTRVATEKTQWALSAGVVACLALVLLGFDYVYNPVPALILGLAFALIVFGATIFGLLLTRPARRLGDISYGLYLLQGPILYLAFVSPAVRSLATASAAAHWTIAMAAATILVLLSSVTHRLIERPGIRAGQWTYETFAAMRSRSVHFAATAYESARMQRLREPASMGEAKTVIGAGKDVTLGR
jgi:peptidoglycan/LPS O-acetylase OafA/YrhL